MALDPTLTRRRILVIGGMLPLAACSLGIDSPATAPLQPATGAPGVISAIAQVIADGGDILAKIESIRAALPGNGQSLLDQGKTLLATLASTQSLDTAKSLISTLAGLAVFLPPPYGTVALAVKTLLPLLGGLVGMRMAPVQTGLTEAQARTILRMR